MEDTRRTWPIESTKQEAYEFTETKAASIDLHGSAAGPLVMAAICDVIYVICDGC